MLAARLFGVPAAGGGGGLFGGLRFAEEFAIGLAVAAGRGRLSGAILILPSAAFGLIAVDTGPEPFGFTLCFAGAAGAGCAFCTLGFGFGRLCCAGGLLDGGGWVGGPRAVFFAVDAGVDGALADFAGTGGLDGVVGFCVFGTTAVEGGFCGVCFFGSYTGPSAAIRCLMPSP